uniref:Uncharacterized protein n=1 Tax=Tanacetum cinerariifolium TaxID=118510 RepID=A0A6L2N2C4_TANCI|nr:hypothetical protein [Tanacetum cinerariifolium]
MMVQAQKEIGEGSTNPTDPNYASIIIQPSVSQPQKKQKSKKRRRKDTELPQTSVPTSVADEAINEEMDDSLERAATTATSLDAEVLDLETIKTTQAMEIESLKGRVNKLEKKQRSRTYKLKRLYKVGLSAGVESSDDEGLGKEDASKQERISDIDTDDDITLVNTHNEQMFDVDQDLHCEEVFIAQQDQNVVKKEVDVAQVQVTTTATTLTISINEATLA